jgi:hypothetical protein
MREKIELPKEEIIDRYKNVESAREISEDFDCCKATILRRLDEWGVEKNSLREYIGVNYAKYKMSNEGYAIWRCRVGESDKSMLVHRLLAVAEFGIEEVKDMDVHHKNGIRWDNRPENIELMSKAEHTSMHMKGHDYNNHWQDRERKENGQFA